MVARSLSIEDWLARLNSLSVSPFTDEGRGVLREALGHANNVVMARAAQRMADAGEAGFIPALQARGLALLGKPAEADKNCRAKEAIIMALEALDNRGDDYYQAAARHVQMEWVFRGEQADTAANLRGYCARALARLHARDAHFTLQRLLLDPESPARLGAVLGLAHLGDERAELLLRMRVQVDDPDPGVLAAGFAALLSIDPDREVPFVASFLRETDSPRGEQAALALGESRTEEGFIALRDCWQQLVDFAFRKTLFLALALTRRDDAFDLLLRIIREEGRGAALKALEALAIYAADAKRRAQIHAAVTAADDPKLQEAYHATFGREP